MNYCMSQSEKVQTPMPVPRPPTRKLSPRFCAGMATWRRLSGERGAARPFRSFGTAKVRHGASPAFESTPEPEPARVFQEQPQVLAKRAPLKTKSRPPVRPDGGSLSHEAAAKSARELAASAATLTKLRERLAAFDGCALKNSATQLVFADGVPDARVMIVGEGPGADGTGRGGLSSAGPGNCWTKCSPPSASTGRKTSISPMSCPGVRRATARRLRRNWLCAAIRAPSD